jgi:hypothetical protein
VPDILFHFGLSRKDIKSLPIIHSIPDDDRRPRRTRVVDVGQAKALGLQISRSLKKMKRDFRARLKAHNEKNRLALFKWHEDRSRGYDRPLP